MKKITIFVFIFLLAFLFAACNKVTTTDTNDSTTNTQVTTNVTPITNSTTEINLSGYDLKSGVYDFNGMSDALKEVYNQEIENYLFDNLLGGIPIYSEYNDFIAYSNRVNLPLDEFNEELYYGELYGSLNSDDSHHIMSNGEYGNVSEYTLRMDLGYSNNTHTFNNQEVSYHNELMNLFYSAGYETRVVEGEAKVVPVLFETDPIPKDVFQDLTVVLQAYTWQFKVKEGLTWAYHPDFDTSVLGQGHEILDASDFVESYNLALKLNNETGSLLEDYQVTNAIEYRLDPTSLNWESVGIKLIDDLTFEMTFDKAYSLEEIIEMFKSLTLSPINIEMYDLLDVEYANSIINTPYNGNYYFDEAVENEFYSLIKIPGKVVNYDGLDVYVSSDDEERMALYESGKIDVIYRANRSGFSDNEYPEFLLLSEGSTRTDIYIGINSFSSDAEYQKRFPGNSFKIEPILDNLNFRKALYLALDRDKIINSIDGYKEPKTGYGNDEDVLEGLSESFGYDLNKAKEYFHQALLEMGNVYKSGDIIKLEVFDMVGIFSILEEELEQGLFDEELEIGVDLVFIKSYVDDKDFSDVFNVVTGYNDWIFETWYYRKYDLIINDNFDFTNYYNSSSHFDKVEVLVEYEMHQFNEESEKINTSEVREAWSFTALTWLLNNPDNKMLITDGRINEDSEPKILNITPIELVISLEGIEEGYISNIEFILYKNISYERFDLVEEYDLTGSVLSYSNLTPGNYLFAIEYDVEYEGEVYRFKERTLYWFLPAVNTYSLIDRVELEGDSVEIYLYNVDRNREFIEDSIIVYSDEYRTPVQCSIEYIGDMAIITGLNPNQYYYFLFLTDDDFSFLESYELSQIIKSYFFT